MEARRISKKHCRVARNRALKLIHDVRKELKNQYKFVNRLVGSGKWGTMIETKEGYDLDYQLILTKNSRSFAKTPTEIKNDFLHAFNHFKKSGECIQNSTTAITLLNKTDQPFHIDFVIIRTFPTNEEIIRRNNKKETPCYNEYTWNKLPKWNNAYEKFNKMTAKMKLDLIENHIIPAKIKEKNKNEADPSKLSSAQVFVREVNNYDTSRKNN